MAVFTDLELQSINQRAAGIASQQYISSNGNVYVGQLNGTLKFVTDNFAPKAQQAVGAIITNSVYNPAVPSIALNSPSSVVVDCLAIENINSFKVATSLGTNGNSTLTSQKNKVIGIALADISSGFSGQVVAFGKVNNPLWSWVKGSKIFLNGTDLSITAPATGYIQIIGTAIATDVIDVRISQSVLL